jgi:hypothetical protein
MGMTSGFNRSCKIDSKYYWSILTPETFGVPQIKQSEIWGVVKLQQRNISILQKERKPSTKQ